MAPRIDPDVGCIIPEKGEWPVDPQEDVEIKEDRLWIDGCFDFFHHGHAGVMLQSRRYGAELLVGLHSDEEIAEHKGPTVMSLAERVAAVDACRFSTKSIPATPYVTSIPWISHYGCQYVTHGDDITSDASGNDCYRFAKRAGRMKIVPRTPGISTTDLVGRMLAGTTNHFIPRLRAALAGQDGSGDEEERKARGLEMQKRIQEYAAGPNGWDRLVEVYAFDAAVSPGEPGYQLNQSRGSFSLLVHGRQPQPGQRIVYVDGGFDLFSSGQIAFLQTVSAMEDELGHKRGWFDESSRLERIRSTGADYSPAYVVAGVHYDDVVNHHRGENYPIMNIFERGLCVVQCTYVHAVIFGAPYAPNQEYLKSIPICIDTGRGPDVVYHGPTAFMPTAGPDPYEDAKAMGIFTETPRHDFQEVNAEQIVQRILDRRAEYEERQRKKGVKGVGEEEHRRREQLERTAQREAASEREVI